jgi:hypothetical protein
MRKEPDTERLVTRGKVERKKARSCAPTRWIDEVTEITEKPVHTLTLEALDQVKWKEVIHDLAVATAGIRLKYRSVTYGFF